MKSYTKLVLIWITILLSHEYATAQSWMNGYMYRKKITVDKAKVSPIVTFSQGNPLYFDLVDFPVLITLEDADLIHNPGDCGNKVLDAQGRDISMALSTAPTTALNFQLESYDAGSGKMRLWVRIPSLSAKMTATAPTSLYLYYGSAVLHVPDSPVAQNTWSANDYSRVWHMNAGHLPYAARNARSNLPEQHLHIHAGMGALNYVTSSPGTGLELNGSSEYLNSGIENSSAVTVSAWIRLKSLGLEQVILTNDTSGSFGTTGYTLKVNASGNLTFEMRIGIALLSNPGTMVLQPGIWYFVTATSNGFDNTLYINGNIERGRSNSQQRLGPGGSVRVGGSKQGSSYFSGTVAGLKIQKVVRPHPWIRTEYENGLNAAAFYGVAAEEYNPSAFSRFTGAVSSAMNITGNWQNGMIPSGMAKVIISVGKTLRLEAGQELIWSSVVLETGATLSLGRSMSLACRTEIRGLATLSVDEGCVVNFGAEVINYGNILAENGALVFQGTAAEQHFKGNGNAKVGRLENTQSASGNVLLLDATIDIHNSVALNKGVLNSNGNLHLLSSKQQGSAAILPLENSDTGIIGIVNVQQYVDGDYPGPATARGWKLWSSPVYHSEFMGIKYSGVEALRNGIFVTGNGGTSNGFDPSPLNSPTVYTHDQSLPGKLSQKYIPIPNILAPIPFGKGICVFSRGNKHLPNAYAEQIQQQPFPGPKGFTLNHSGLVHTGDLSITLANKNEGREGDGFNLLGNPYPSAIYWAGLDKTNLTDFVWLFDPLNNAYMVSDLPETTIASGSAFFVKVLNGAASGNLTFKEQSKYVAPNSSLSRVSSSGKIASVHINNKTHTERRLSVALERSSFKQHCIVKYKAGGNDGLDDRDAAKLDEGYVDISCVVEGRQLGINERSVESAEEVILRVKGWEAGKYRMSFQGMETFGEAKVMLVDKYLNKKQPITEKDCEYIFTIDPGIASSHGAGRFSITLKKENDKSPELENSKTVIYPNPFHDVLYVKRDGVAAHLVTLIDAMGRTITQRSVGAEVNILSEIDKTRLTYGIYILRVSDGKSTINFKLMRQ